MTHPLDVLAMGRSGVDLYPLQIGVGLEDVTTFGKFLGGSAANVSVAAARLGHSVALVTGVGDDPFGRFVRRALRDLGVDDRLVITDRAHPTPVTFCEIFPPDDFPLYFYRRPAAPRPADPAGRPRPRRRPRRPAALGDRHRAVGGAEPVGPLRRLGGPWPPPAHGPRPGLPADVLVLPGGGHRAGPGGAAERNRRRGQPGGVRGRDR